MMYKCRACLIKCEEDQISCMDLNENLPAVSSNITIADALSEIACVCIVGDFSNQPTKICSSCCYRLQEAYIFIRQVQESASIIEQCSSIGQPPMMQFVAPRRDDNDTKNINKEWCNVDKQESKMDTVIAKTCLEDVRIANVQSQTELGVEFKRAEETENGCDLLTENEIKKEPELQIEPDMCDEQYSYNDNFQIDYGNSSDANRMNKICQTVENNMDNQLTKCVCRYLQHKDHLPKETIESLRNHFVNMNPLNRNLFIRSLMHVCRCEEKLPKNGCNNTNSSSLENPEDIAHAKSFDKRGIKVIYTVHCDGEFVSVNRDLFINIFSLTEKTAVLEDNNKLNCVYSDDFNESDVKLEQSDEEKDTEYSPTMAWTSFDEPPSTKENSKSDDKSQCAAEQCMLCSKHFKSIASLKRHVIVYHSYFTGEMEQTSCSMEDLTNNSLLQEIKKMKKKRNVKNFSLPCSYCSNKFANQGALASHKKYCIKRHLKVETYVGS